MAAPKKVGYLNGHPTVSGVSVDLLHKMENGRDVGVDVRVRGIDRPCILVHRSCVMRGTGSGRAVSHDVLFPDERYSVYEWDASRRRVKDTGIELGCVDAAKAAAEADDHYRKTKGLAISLSTVGRNNSPGAVHLASVRNNTITDAYLAGQERGQQDDDEFDL